MISEVQKNLTTLKNCENDKAEFAWRTLQGCSLIHIFLVVFGATWWQLKYK